MAARVFLDTSVLIAAAFSDAGGARMVLRLGEAHALTVCASGHVLGEADRVLRRKAPNMLVLFAVLIEQAGLEIVPAAAASHTKTFHALTGHAGDAQVIADAAAAKADYFVTLDKEHFLGNRKLRSALIFPLGTPGDFIAWFKRQLPG